MAGYRFTCDRRALARAVRRAVQVVGTGTRPEINAAWLTIDEGMLSLAVTRPPVTLVGRVPVDGRGRGSLLVPLWPFRRIVLSRRSGDVDFEGDDDRIELRSRTFRAELNAIPPKEFVRPLPPVDPTQTASLPGSSFRAGLEHVALSLGHRYGWRPRLAGLELTVRSGSLRMAATDHITLAVTEHNDPSVRIPFSSPVVLPPEAVDPLGRHLLVRNRAEVRLGAGQVDFVTSDTTIRCELPIDTFPDYEPIRSTRTTRRCTVDRLELLTTVERVAALSRGDTPARVWLGLEPATITARALDRQVGSALDICPADVDGAPCEVGVYLWTLVACLRQLKGSDVVIEVGNPRKRMSIYGAAFPQRRYHILPLAVEAPRRS